jgi:hypothetical protein
MCYTEMPTYVSYLTICSILEIYMFKSNHINPYKFYFVIVLKNIVYYTMLNQIQLYLDNVTILCSIGVLIHNTAIFILYLYTTYNLI